MPNILPQLLSALTRRAISPPIEMYLRILLGSGAPMTKLPPALERNLAGLTLEGTNPMEDGFEDWALRKYGTLDANPYNLGYADYGSSAKSPDAGGLRAREMASQRSPLMTMRSLGSFRATPVGRDSVRINDTYDFENDTQAESGLYTSPFIKTAQEYGIPYDIDATIAAPKLNRQLRQRELTFAAARRRVQKDMQAELLKVLGGGK